MQALKTKNIILRMKYHIIKRNNLNIKNTKCLIVNIILDYIEKQLSR